MRKGSGAHISWLRFASARLAKPRLSAATKRAEPVSQLQRFSRKNFLFRRCSAGVIGLNPCWRRIFSASRTDMLASAGRTGTRMITGTLVREVVFDGALIVGMQFAAHSGKPLFYVLFVTIGLVSGDHNGPEIALSDLYLARASLAPNARCGRWKQRHPKSHNMPAICALSFGKSFRQASQRTS